MYNQDDASKIKDHKLEEFEIRGYTVLEDVIKPEECKIIESKLDALYEDELKEYGLEKLLQIGERGFIRGLIEKDPYFANLMINPIIYGFVSKSLRDTAIIHSQNGLIIEPEIKHKMSYYHRDLPFLNFVSDKVFMTTTLLTLNDFNSETGGTWVAPFTHKMAERPSDEYLEKYGLPIVAKAGSVVVFNSMLYHKGGHNLGGTRRRAIVQIYSRPFIKQQIDYPSLLKGKVDVESKVGQVLGFWSVPPKSEREYRNDPDKRTYRSGQG